MNIEKYKGFKALYVEDDYFIGAKGYKLYKYTFATKKFEYYGRVADSRYSIPARFSITRRLLRAEINNLYMLPSGAELIIAKKGIFKREKGASEFLKCFTIPRGSRPLNLCITPEGRVFFGEYFANMDKGAVHIYQSKDQGDNWEKAYTFEAGNINHIHGLFWDKYTNRIWFATGDRDNECIIGYTEDYFQSTVEVFRGGQEYRTCNLFFYPEYIVFATDSQYIVNEIKLFHRKTKEIKSLSKIQGTAIKGGQNGNMAYLSTTVEPSEVNTDRDSHVWISQDGVNWSEIYSAHKDCLPAIFQFGSIEFPAIKSSKHLIFSGRALSKIDGCSIKISL